MVFGGRSAPARGGRCRAVLRHRRAGVRAILTSKRSIAGDVTERLVAAVRARADGRSPDALEHILRALLQRGVPEEVQRLDSDTLAAFVGWIHDFHQERVPGEAKVRVVEPTLEHEGWDLPFALVVVATEDRPFLVDSVSMAITESGPAVRFVFHPQFRVVRDDHGRLQRYLADAGQRSPEALDESLMTFWLERPLPEDVVERLTARIDTALVDVEAAVSDWQAMRARAEALAAAHAEPRPPLSEADREEARAFLQWLAHHHFLLLGYREYEVAGSGDERVLQLCPESGLGILRTTRKQGRRRSVRALEQRLAEFGDGPVPLVFTKTDARSTVHRRGHMDYVGVLHYDADGHITGESRFVGLYTASTYHRSVWDIPFVRRKADAVLERSALRADSHGGKALINILETLPRDELFQSTTDELYELALGILELEARARTRVFVRRDHVAQFFSCLVFIPRERFNTEVRQRVQAILRAHLGGAREDFSLQLGGSDLVRVHFIVRPEGECSDDYDVAAIEDEVVAAARSWHDDLREQLIERHGERAGMRLARRFEKALPAAYIDQVPPRVALFDVEKVDGLSGPDDIAMSLYEPLDPTRGVVRFKVFKHDHTIPLSVALPMLEDMGLRALTERPYELRMPNGDRIWIQDFDLQPTFTAVRRLDLDQVREPFQEAFEQIWRGRTESDGFNRLILGAGMDWRQAALLRALCRYLLQTGVPFSHAYMADTLSRHPLIARLLIEFFAARFDPHADDESAAARAQAGELLAATCTGLLGSEPAPVVEGLIEQLQSARAEARAARTAACREALETLLDRVASLDEDRILRAFFRLIEAIVRTSYYRTGSARQPRPWVAFKIDSARVPDLPRPHPLVEVFVHSPRMEGIHLRGGQVARGGLRWSDRREDFRTEVLGLMRAQSVKNTLIVPVGAKGGFVTKQLPAGGDRAAVQREGVDCYRQFIHGLLDITDNITPSGISHPPAVVRHDEPDPYLVVAADKGTATFSDIANGIAAEHGFWLDDAFASGGSNGYDHKAMGITARGAWESVKRHFRELGRDCQSEPFTAVGIGDMGGDVFGNGMLLSRQTRLVAAFNHLHIFIDPDPDPATSYAERERLFAQPGAGWDDYDRNCISAGGGVWSRQAKEIALTPEVRAALDITAEALTPSELIRAILRAPVDLLWNGGIGTYVKASDEADEAAGDRANRLVRVDGRELRCRVVGEGGNLGLTQRGRIEYALHGGRINTDFIDNSGGVDCSDHEVNIKILLNDVVAAGDLDAQRRNALLAEMTDEVAALVLRNNYLQAQALTMMEAFAQPRLGTKAHLITWLEQQGHIDRALECLPDDETIEERRLRGQALVRPELAVLLSHAKIALYPQLLGSELPEDPYLASELVEYFPTPLREPYAEVMRGHRLAREIIATQVTNEIVNRMGASFVLRMTEDTGAQAPAIARAYTIARDVVGAPALWQAIEALDGEVAASLQTDLLLRVWEYLRHATRWLLNRPGADLAIGSAVAAYGPGFAVLRDHLDEVVVAGEGQDVDAAAAELAAAGVPQSLAADIARLGALYPAFDIIEVANAHGLKVEHAGQLYARLGEAFSLSWLRARIAELPVEGAWHANARGSLLAELYQRHRALAESVISAHAGGDAEAAIAQWLAACGSEAERVQRLLAEMQRLPQLDYATAVVALRALERLIGESRQH